MLEEGNMSKLKVLPRVLAWPAFFNEGICDVGCPHAGGKEASVAVVSLPEARHVKEQFVW